MEIAVIDPRLKVILKKYTKNKEWVEANRYTNSIYEYILAGKDDYEQVNRLAGVMAAVQILLQEDDYLLLDMMTGISEAKGIDLMKSASELRDFRVTQDRKN